VNTRQLFLQHNAQTSQAPMSLEIIKAEGCELTDVYGKKYLDLIGGISVANIGHRHPTVLDAIKKQLDDYLHVMVYGEFIQSPQVQYAKLLTDHLPSGLESVYFTNSGAEAVEGAMKLAKRITRRTEIIAFNRSYHGSTQGALSIIGDEYWRNSFRPLLPDIRHLNYNSFEHLKYITENTACVIVETIQAEAGIIAPLPDWILTLSVQCKKAGAFLILDEIQAGFGRTGMPLGAFISSKSNMDHLTDNPVLGHITTFGGHPVCCAAGMAAFEVLLKEKWYLHSQTLMNQFVGALTHPLIKKIRSFGLWMALQFESFATCKNVIDQCIEKGVITDWFLFAPECMRISPPLSISKEQLQKAAEIINNIQV
jgi:acetylornithine/N-succinyldiaminopimelate aminotransferase